LIGAGRWSEEAMDAANLLKPALALGNFMQSAATHPKKQYQKLIEKKQKLRARFQTVNCG